MKPGLLIAYFTQRDDALGAYRKLWRQGFLRAAWVSKGADGAVRTGDPYPLRRAMGSAAAFALFAAVAAWAASHSAQGTALPAGYLHVLFPALAAGMIGSLLGWVMVRRSQFGVDQRLLDVQASRLIAGETVLILQAPSAKQLAPVAMLREVGEVPPAVFILHPAHAGPGGDPWPHEPPANPAQLQDHAQRLAAEHMPDPKPLRNSGLIKRLGQGRRWVQQICLDLSELSQLQQSVPPAAEWLLDNEYILESNSRDVQRNLPWSYYRQLPVLSSEPYRGLPRIYALAREFVMLTDLRMDQHNILSFIDSYQSVAPLTIGELWAVPQMIRTVLIEGIQQIAGRVLDELREREIADLWSNRLITANRRDPNQLFSLMAELTAAHPEPSPYLATQLIDHLYDEGAALAPVQSWLERTFDKSLNDLIMREKIRQPKDQISISNAFASLRQLSLLDWKECFEQLSLVERVLRQDPAGIYPQMDFVTRDRYRQAIEDMRRGSRLPEEEIARRVLDMASQTPPEAADEALTTHVGTYLIGEKRRDLAREIGCRETVRFRALDWALHHHTAVYFTGLVSFTSLFIFLVLQYGLNGQALWIYPLAVLFLLVPASQLSLDILNYLVMRLFPPRPLPKMDFLVSGIPDSCKTLVVVPMLLLDEETIRAEAERLEIRYLANKEDNLLFGLFSDYTDATELHRDGDEALLQTATTCIAALNERYEGDRFFLLHRERKWSESEQKYIGWERKRGKLEELNGLITGNRPRDAEPLLHVGDPDRLIDIRFVITLDSDTQLPHDTARRMIETLAHPLVQPRFDKEGRVRAGSCTIIQPRVSPSLPSTSGSPFSRLFSEPVGIDPYTNTVSDAYQDLTGEGSYHGKGIYDVRAFDRMLTGRFPDAWLLSHDLLEGAHVRVGLASDIELYDEFPQDYVSYVKRQHRWIRGDWQIAAWIFPRVPLPGGGRGPNPLSWFDRWKVFDNLRRSLLPAANLSLLFASWLTSPEAGWIATGFVAAQLFFHSLAQPFTWATTAHGLMGISLSELGHDFTRVLVEAALLPHQALLALDAIARVLYRRNISHRKLLEWTTARVMAGKAKSQKPAFLLSLGLASLACVTAAAAVSHQVHANVWMTSPWLFLWAMGLPAGWYLSRGRADHIPQFQLGEEDRVFLGQVARRTWRFFDDFVNESTSWLPPDNYQVSHQNQLAMRTSPTNIGLYMASVLSAYNYGYITVDSLAQRLTLTMGTIRRLQLHEGHLLNWYDIRTLEPLPPLYVSTVDSGNFLGSLWTINCGLETLMHVALLDDKAFHGLRDTGEVLRLAMVEAGNSRRDMTLLTKLSDDWISPPARACDALAKLRSMDQALRETQWDAMAGEGEASGVLYWRGKLQEQLAAWTNNADRYLLWMEILAEKTEEDIAGLDPDLLPAYRQALGQAPSLTDLAEGNIPCIAAFRSMRDRSSGSPGGLPSWIDRLLAAFDRSRWLAGEMRGFADQLARDCRELSDSANMSFLYNTDRRLFSVGYFVSEGYLDKSFYDLLASEARLGSFISIARGDIPAHHWFAMGRPYGAIGSRRALLSWAGTMFEYLMPLLFQRSYDYTLLDKAVREAVLIQIKYGRRRKIPWGISECAFGDLDHNKTYQYYAFGVPELGLRRGLPPKIVVAPYATMMALGVAQKESIKNLRLFAEMGLLREYGYYESLDFSRKPTREGERGVIVRAYMAHHQGMSLLALANFLHEDCIRGYFHSDPRVRTFEPLLHERIPHLPPLHHVSARERISPATAVGEIVHPATQADTPHTAIPKTQLLCNGRYALMLTGAGGGYSQWDDFEITRWRSDLTRDSWGTFCYVHDTDANRLWCNSYHPIGGSVDQYGVSFTLDRADFRRVDQEIETKTEVIVAPEDDVEIRRITLINRSTRTRRLALTSYIELSLAPHNADLQHPAFNKMFIETGAMEGEHALLAWRRERGSGEKPVCVAHRLTMDKGEGTPDVNPLRYETDRRRFIGRGRTLANPMGATQEPGNSQGNVLDPIFSLRQDLALAPGKRAVISMVLAAGSSREQVAGLMNKYGDPPAIDRAMDYVWASAQLELRLLRIQPDDARRFQQLASHLLFPNPLQRSSGRRIAENRKGQAGLWTYSISGDLPVVLMSINATRDLGLVRQMLQAHTYWRLHGLKADLVILNEESAGYAQPLRDELEQLIHTHSSSTGADTPGGVYLRSADMIPEEDRILLGAVASVAMVATRGTLPRQLGVALDTPDMPELVTKKRDPRDPSAALPFMELHFFNSLGGFTQDGKEYAIYLGPGLHTPAPWVNVMANPSFGTMASETGAGFTWQGNSQRNRLTQWSNDPVMDTPSEAIYIRDEDTGAYWTPTASPIREDTAYRARHGAGYTVYEHNSHGIEQNLVVFVPVDDQGGKPVKLQRLTLRNDTGRPRRLSLTYYVEWTLGETRESSQMHVVTNWDDEVQVLTARNYYNPDYPGQVAFAAMSPLTMSYTADRTVFLGRNRSMKNPAAMDRTRLARRTGAGFDPCAALQVFVKLAPGEQMDITCMLGQAPSTEQVDAMVLGFRDHLQVEAALRQTREWWDNRLGMLQVRTPELSTDILVNRWLLYQTLSCRIWGRSAFYQSGGAFGFRDQLQDVMALLHTHPQLARDHILLAASRQFQEGDVQHWWHPPGGAGIRSRISDDLLWLPYVVAQYVRVTADTGILFEMVPFLSAPLLNEGQHESFQQPGIAHEPFALFEHLRRAVSKGRTSGAHGLPLMGTGDWNDGMNLVGAGGKGESVWLAWFVAEVLEGMAEMSDLLDRHELSREYRSDRQALTQHIEQFAWDGAWYLRATFDDGTPLGSSASEEAQIDSLPQSWAWLTGAADPDRAVTALDSAWNRLVLEEEGMVLLFEPPFEHADPSPGYIKGYPPGVRENGGQYTHAAIWLAMAMARSGSGERAAKIMRMLNPVEHARDPESVWRYGTEPYVIAADVYRLPGRTGQGGWSWYTGSAAWMYRAWVEELLGLKVRGETMRINPVIPEWWDGFQMSYRHAEAMYEIQVENPEHVDHGVVRVELDGKPLEDGIIPLLRESVKHRVLVLMGKPTQ
jgi:cyclic beta-1,2-glucan synthetase